MSERAAPLPRPQVHRAVRLALTLAVAAAFAIPGGIAPARAAAVAAKPVPAKVLPKAAPAVRSARTAATCPPRWPYIVPSCIA